MESYSKELLSVVGEDYDFAVKWIEENYKEALGTNDAEKAKFMREVANKVEAKVGRIQFDYNTGKYRAEADKTTALARLKEDESVLRNRYAQEDTLAREQQNASLNSRGLMDNNREEVSGLGGRDISRLEQQMSDRMTSLDRSIARDTQDINLGFTRGNEDLTTAARRAALDSEQQRSYGLESSELAKKRQEAEIKRQKSAALRSLPGLAQSEALQRLGYS